MTHIDDAKKAIVQMEKNPGSEYYRAQYRDIAVAHAAVAQAEALERLSGTITAMFPQDTPQETP